MMTFFCNVDCCFHGNPRVVEGRLGYVAEHASLIEDVSLVNNEILEIGLSWRRRLNPYPIVYLHV